MKKATFTMNDGSKKELLVRSLDSIPKHNHDGLWLKIEKDDLINLCIERIFTILKSEKVGMFADLVDQVMEELNIIPNFSYKELGEELEKDERFDFCNFQICSLKGTDPVGLMAEKLEGQGL